MFKRILVIAFVFVLGISSLGQDYAWSGPTRSSSGAAGYGAPHRLLWLFANFSWRACGDPPNNPAYCFVGDNAPWYKELRAKVDREIRKGKSRNPDITMSDVLEWCAKEDRKAFAKKNAAAIAKQKYKKAHSKIASCAKSPYPLVCLQNLSNKIIQGFAQENRNILQALQHFNFQAAMDPKAASHRAKKLMKWLAWRARVTREWASGMIG